MLPLSYLAIRMVFNLNVFTALGEFNPDDIVEWVENAKKTPFPHLSDETFEHLTQASTGSTTGDWLIML